MREHGPIEYAWLGAVIFLLLVAVVGLQRCDDDACDADCAPLDGYMAGYGQGAACWCVDEEGRPVVPR